MQELCDEQPPSTLARACRMKLLPLVLRLDRVVPVVAGLEQAHPGFELEDVVVADVGRPGLQHAHARLGVLGEARRDHAARSAAADDDVVELIHVLACLVPALPLFGG